MRRGTGQAARRKRRQLAELDRHHPDGDRPVEVRPRFGTHLDLAIANLRLGGWIERNVLGRLPLYSALKSLTKAFREAGEGAAFRPALLGSSEGVREVIYVVEDQDTGEVQRGKLVIIK